MILQAYDFLVALISTIMLTSSPIFIRYVINNFVNIIKVKNFSYFNFRNE